MENFKPGWQKRRTTVSEILRNDEDNEKLYQKIVELLIAAGGITWTLTGSFCDVDIEFKDEMNLAEKIKVSEKITAALSSVKCPVILNPVQLQGLDLNTIYQVLQWLVKKLIETRDERNLKNKVTANSYYDTMLNSFIAKKTDNENLESKVNNFNLIKPNSNPAERFILLNEISNEKKTEFINETTKLEFSNKTKDLVNKQEKALEAKYHFLKKGRIFRPSNTYNFDYNDPLRVYFNLIEYGMNKDITFQKNLIELLKKKGLVDDTKDKDSKKPNINADASVKNKDTAAASKTSESADISNDEKKKLEEILTTNIIEVANLTNKVSNSVIEEIFSENIDVIVNEIEKYETIKEDENFDKIKYLNKEKERLLSNKTNLDFQITEYEKELKFIRFQVDSEIANVEKINVEVNNLKKILTSNEENFTKLNDKIKNAKISNEKMELIGEKIKQRDELKENIQKFKKECLEEKQVLESQIDALERKNEKMNENENLEVFEEIDRNYNETYEKLLDRKKDLFEQNKIINLLTRRIQVFPSKLELIQYQKRFQELYEQINNVVEKLKNLNNEVNAKEEVKKLLNQKLEVFLQLKDCFKNTKTKKDKENFKVNLVNVLESLDEMIVRSNERLKEFNKSLEKSKEMLNDLQLYENKYMKLIKEYNKEFNRSNKGYVA